MPKKSLGLRLVINIKPLNLFIKKENFKMETTKSIRKALSPGDWVTSIDLKNMYFHLPIAVGGVKIHNGSSLPLNRKATSTEAINSLMKFEQFKKLRTGIGLV